MASERRPHVVREEFVNEYAVKVAYANAAMEMLAREYGSLYRFPLRRGPEYTHKLTRRLARYLAFVDRRAAEKERG